MYLLYAKNGIYGIYVIFKVAIIFNFVKENMAKHSYQKFIAVPEKEL